MPPKVGLNKRVGDESGIAVRQPMLPEQLRDEGKAIIDTPVNRADMGEAELLALENERLRDEEKRRKREFCLDMAMVFNDN